MTTTPASPAPVPARRFTDAVERPSTVIGPGIRVRGALTGDDPVEIAGTLEGDSRTSAHYVVREGGRVVGRVEATSIVVAGEMTGPELAADKVEIGARARVTADIRARVVAIAEGAVFDGQVQMQGNDATGPITFKEQRSARPPEPR
jgi:cytoskeletal protein CcmA (bactofilin family)